MIAADTNVWARAYLNDDVKQARRARTAIEAGCGADGVFVPLVVLAELFWVLRSRWSKERVLDTLAHLLDTEGVTVEAQAAARQALADARSSGVGFADLLIAQIAFARGAGEIITFDRAFGRRPRVRRLG